MGGKIKEIANLYVFIKMVDLLQSSGARGNPFFFFS